MGSDPDKVFSYDLMMEHFRKYGKIGLIYAATMLPILTADEGKQLNLDDVANQCNDGGELSFASILTEESKIKYHQRLRDVIVDMVRLEYV